MSGASVETTLALWASSLREVKRRTRPLFTQARVARSAIGNAVMAYSSPNDAGFVIKTCGANQRVPVDLDGFTLMSFLPAPGAAQPQSGPPRE